MTTTSSPGPSLILPPAPSDASSLRAAALKTLKLGKRRRPASGQPQTVPPARPVIQDTFQLDYGQDDNATEPPRSPQVAPTTTSLIQSTASVPPDTRIMDVDSREEGEISDEDTSPTGTILLDRRLEQNNDGPRQTDHPSVLPTSPQSKSPVPVHLTRVSVPQSRIHSTSHSPVPSTPYTERKPYPSDSNRDQTIISSSHFTRGTSRDRSPHHRNNRSSSPNTYFVPAHDPFPLVDAEHVRPGLTMTHEEYDTAKDIVLDLLGWGVPPEYLVDCGLTRRLIYYIFTELNLKLPPNLDTTGILLYRPSTYTPMAVTDPEDSPTSQLTSRIEDPIQRLQSPKSPDSFDQVDDGSAYSVKATPPPVAAPIPEDLHDMERQRRQELIARKKAVQSSRKAKRGTIGGGSTGTQSLSTFDTDVVMATPAPSETVENFLKSIGPADQAEVSPPRQLSLEPAISATDGMDVDEIPGLGSARSSLPLIPSPTSHSPPSSGGSVTTSSSTVQQDQLIPVLSPRTFRKRGPRRPVASDFVDVDDPQTPVFNSGASDTIRLKLQSSMSFANISNMRRCIIDLSDSESDDDKPEDGGDQVKRPQITPATWAFNNPNMSAVSSRSSPVPLASIKARSGNVTPSPDALALEIKIQKMREEIAQREKNQKRKALAKLSTVYTSDAIPPSVTPSSVETPQESREQSVIPQLHTHLESPFQLDRSPGSDWSYAGPPYQGASKAPDDSGFATPSIDDLTYLRTTDDPSYPQSEGLQAHATEPWPLRVQASDPTDGLDSDEREPPSPASDADLNSSSSARALEDVQERAVEPQSPMKFPPNTSDQTFQRYQSTLTNYPLLRTQMTPRQYTSDSIIFDTLSMHRDTPSNVYSHSPHFALPDLQPLKLATIMQYLDPLKQLCQYEVPGGGVCRDEGCEDVHLSRLTSIEGEVMEPSDQDTANFLLGVTPGEWQARHNVTVGKMITALTMVRQSVPLMTLSFEERVARAMALFERPLIPKTS